jgi:hypothetical protein
MRVAIMQPYFFPYIGYFSLIKYCDKFIFFDTVQFIRHGWINRNRILSKDKGWTYITVPVKKHLRSAAIKDVEISYNGDWRNRMLGQLNNYKKIAPYYRPVISFIKDCFAESFGTISELNIYFIEKTCHYIGIEIDTSVFSEMNLLLGDIQGPGDWALEIAKALKADEYVNLPGGRELFGKAKFNKQGTVLCFMEHNLNSYDQKRQVFEPALSIIDVMMFNDKKEINRMLDDVKLTT